MTITQASFDTLDLVDGADNNQVPKNVDDAFHTLNSSYATPEQKIEACLVLSAYLSTNPDVDGMASVKAELQIILQLNLKAAVADALGIDVGELSGFDLSSASVQQLSAVVELLSSVGLISPDVAIGPEGISFSIDSLLSQAVHGSPAIASGAIAQLFGALSTVFGDHGLDDLSSEAASTAAEFQVLANLASTLAVGPEAHPGGSEGWLAAFDLFSSVGSELGMFDRKTANSLVSLEGDLPSAEMVGKVRNFIFGIPESGSGDQSMYGSPGSSGNSSVAISSSEISTMSLDAVFAELEAVNEGIIAAVLNGDPVEKSRLETHKMIMQMRIQLLMSIL